jgi:hypothetical protein
MPLPYPKNQLAHTLSQLTGKVRVFPKGIPAEVLVEFRDWVQKYTSVGAPKAADAYALALAHLQNPEVATESVKKCLVDLALSQETTAYRYLQQLETAMQAEFLDFLAAAQMQAQTRMEHTLTGEQSYYISTPLGGQGDCLRYFWVISELSATDEGRKRFVVQEFEQAASSQGISLESTEANSQSNHLVFRFLAPYTLFLPTFLRKFLAHYDWLDGHYWLSNVQAPTPTLIEDWLNKKQHKDKKL